MSYDLYFYVQKENAISGESFASYFNRKTNFTVSDLETGGLQAWYENKDTGVYFSVEFSPSPSPNEEEIPTEFFDTGVSFNMNYNRPSFFAYEAMPLVIEFANEFHLCIYDPQEDQSEGGVKLVADTNSDDLIRTWSRCNVGAVEFYRESGATEPHLSLEKSIDTWRYMQAKSILCDSLPEFFVPKYFLLRKKAVKKSIFRRGTPMSREVLRVIVWGEGVFQLLPECDYFMILKGDPSSPSEKGLIRYEEVILQMSPYLIAVENEHVSNLKGIPEYHIEQILPVFRKFQTMPVDNYEGVALNSFVDVPWS